MVSMDLEDIQPYLVLGQAITISSGNAGLISSGGVRNEE